MSDPDTTQPHVLTAPHQPAFSGCWYAWCTCGEEFMAGTAQGVRDLGLPHRLAEIARLRRVPGEWPENARFCIHGALYPAPCRDCPGGIVELDTGPSEVERRGPDVGE